MRIYHVLLFVLVSLWGCTLVPLIEEIEEVETVTDVKGVFCSENPEDLDYPVKVLFILDSSGSMRGSDAEKLRVSAVEEVFAKFLPKENYYFGMMIFSTDLLILTPADDPFTRDGAVLADALAQVPEGDGMTNYSAALSQAFTLISNDIRQYPNESERTTYVTVFLSDGVPTDRMGDAHYLNLVTRIVDLQNQSPGCMRSTVNTAYLQNGTRNDAAYNLLQNMASVGGGSFQSFEDNSEISFDNIDLSYTTRTYKMWNMLVTNRNVHPTKHGIAVDSDGDGIIDEKELEIGSDPLSRDTDKDGCQDGAELAMSWPLDQAPSAVDPDHCICPDESASIDFDDDGLNDCEEQFVLTKTNMPDSDLDGFTDWIEMVYGTYPTINDSLLDPDLDQTLNGEEIITHRSTQEDDEGAREMFSYEYEINEGPDLGTGQRCYDIEVTNIALLPTLATDEHEAGVNFIDIYVAQTPSDQPGQQILYRKLTKTVSYPDEENDEKAPASVTFTADDFAAMF